MPDADGFLPVDFRIAWSTCRAVRKHWLIRDPLEFQEIGESPPPSPPQRVDVEFLTKNRPGGGLRLEVLPDIFTGVFLQAVADRLGMRDLGLTHSLSARLFGLRLKQENPYAAWSSMVPAWIHRQLASGRVLLMADIRDYFPSIAPAQLTAALRRAGLEGVMLDQTLHLIDRINAAPDFAGGTRRGLPVSPEEFFWLAADLVLAPVDEEIRESLNGADYARWVDDFFVAGDRGCTERDLARLRSIVERHGFALNDRKTRVIGSVEEFEEAACVADHAILTDLFLTQTHGALSGPQQDAWQEMAETLGTSTIEQRRVWKRLYGLAARLGSRLLVDRAIADLERMPDAGLQIVRYLQFVDWPGQTGRQALELLTPAASDAQWLASLWSLARAGWGPEPEDRARLREIVRRAPHPFASVLAMAALQECEEPPEWKGAACEMLRGLPAWKSAMARRVGVEVLWQDPDLRRELETCIAADPSSIVNGLSGLHGRWGEKLI